MCGAFRSTPGPPPAGRVCMCPMEKNPTTTPHLFTQISPTAPQRCRPAPCKHQDSPRSSLRTLPPSHRLRSCASSFPRSPGDKRDAPASGAAIQVLRERMPGKGLIWGAGVNPRCGLGTARVQKRALVEGWRPPPGQGGRGAVVSRAGPGASLRHSPQPRRPWGVCSERARTPAGLLSG